MAWVRVDDRMARGPKVKRAALKLGGKHPRARILAAWLECMSYCNLQLTNGFVPDFEVADLDDNDPSAVFLAMSFGDELLGAIVERDDARGGWVFRNYAKYQPTKEETEEKAEKERERKRVHREFLKRPSGRITDTAPLVSDESRNPITPIRPEPNRSDPIPKEKTRRAKRADSVPSEGFEEFWQAYPLKVAKEDAIKAWNQLSPSAALREFIGAALIWQRPSLTFEKDGQIKGKYPAAWLRGKRWEDERPPSARRATSAPESAGHDDNWREECQRIHGGTCADAGKHRYRAKALAS